MAGFTKLMEISLTTSFLNRLQIWILWLDHIQFTNKKSKDCNMLVSLLFLIFKTNKTSLILVPTKIECHSTTAIKELTLLWTKWYQITLNQSMLITYSKHACLFMTFMILRTIRFSFMIHVVCQESQHLCFATWLCSKNHLINRTISQNWLETSRFNTQCQIPTSKWLRL